MKSYQVWAAPAVLAALLGAMGLGYAHLQFEGAYWVFQVMMTSIWRAAAGTFSPSLLHAGFLLLPVAVVTLIFAKAFGGDGRARN